MAKENLYGTYKLWEICINIIQSKNGQATVEDVHNEIIKRFPKYEPKKDNARISLLRTTVNANRSYWEHNCEARRTDDLNNKNHKYDRLYRRGKFYEIYQPEKHGVYEIYQSSGNEWLSREVKTDSEQQVTEFEKQAIEFEELVKAASKMSAEQRKKNLPKANTTPERVEVTTTVFKRNAVVVAEVLTLANGKCQNCNKDAPFNRANGTPFLEVHHVKWLSKGGEDSVNNAVALCPNCHRQAHHGKLLPKAVNASM